MKKEEILNMQPGREMDALIAEKVFNIKILTEEEMTREAINVWVNQPDCRMFLMGFTAYPDEMGNPECRQNFHEYSTSISAAWKVVEKLQDLQKCVEFRNAWRRETPFDFSQFTAKTMSWFICRTALLTVMEEK